MPASTFPRKPSARLRGWMAAVVVVAGAGIAWSVQAGERVALLRYSAPVPAHWQPQTPSSQFRLAQFRVPAAPGATDGEVVVFHFGTGQGGSAAANIARWRSQFTGADGLPVQPRVETLRVGGLPATLAELSGTYARALAGVPAAPRGGQTLLAAVVEAPEGNVIFQLHGDRATVETNRAAFLAMVTGWKP
jgi:hypothetical protein